MTHETEDDIVDALKKYGIPVTRENYLDLAYLGHPPEMTAELEANLPEALRAPSSDTQIRVGEDATRYGTLRTLRTINLPPTDDFLACMGGEL